MKKSILKFGIISLAIGTLASLSSCGSGDIPADEVTEDEASLIPIEKALEVLARENDIARTLYTKGIVGPGKKAGLKFDENWRKDDVEAGPLPALFLRGISSDIQKGSVPLGLFLGSDFPINSANKFEGKQAELFSKMRQDSMPKFFLDEGSKLHTAMFPDFASAEPCVSCHNEHPETTKKDWKLGDIMGATTWTYPKDKLTYKEVEEMLAAYHTGIANTMGQYISEIDGFKNSPKPEIGTKWPTEGMFIPTPQAFLDSVKVLSSAKSLESMLTQK